jgi:hypothetical protein
MPWRAAWPSRSGWRSVEKNENVLASILATIGAGKLCDHDLVSCTRTCPGRGQRPARLQGSLQGRWDREALDATGVASFIRVTDVQFGVPVEEITRIAGHSSTRTTEVVYRRELRPILTTGAEAMDRLFGPNRCTADLMAVAIRSAVGVSDGCSAEANSAAQRASLAAGCASASCVLACMWVLLLVWVTARAPGGPAAGGVRLSWWG